MRNFFILIVFILFFIFSASAQRGKDGVKTVNATEVVNAFTPLTSNAAIGDTFIVVTSNVLNTNFSSSLSRGDLLMIYQAQGATIEDNTNGVISSWPKFKIRWGQILNYNNAGNYEFVQVDSVLGDGITIVLDCALRNNYTVSGHVVVVRVPRYLSLTINNGGTINTFQWNGSTGGIVAIEVLGQTIINAGGSINTSGLGFRAGQAQPGTPSTVFGGLRYADSNPLEGAEKGEGIAGYHTEYDNLSDNGARYCRGAAANAGGGGNGHNAGGGGGANAGNVNNWNNGVGVPDSSLANYVTAWGLDTTFVNPTVTSSGGGRGGYSILRNDQNELTTPPNDPSWGGDFRRDNGGLGGRPLDYSTGKIFIGGGGGAGDGDNGDQTSGGNGGGLIFLSTYDNISGSGKIISNGADGIDVNPGGAPFGQLDGRDAAGGAGAGGTVIIQTTGIVSVDSITAIGGQGGDHHLYRGNSNFETLEAQGPGGGGSGGYIALTSGTPNRSVLGGANGVSLFTSNGSANDFSYVANFPPNGATFGGTGIANGSIDAFDFTVNGTSICVNTSTSLTANFTGTPPVGAQFEWYDSEFNGTLLFTGASFTTPILSATTTYWVKLCPAPYAIPVTVTVTPCASITANLSSTDSTLCLGDCIDFNDISAGAPNVWRWYFPGSSITTSNLQNPTNICYNTAGTFDVSLFVSDGSNTDSLYLQNFITVNALPIVTAGNDTSICLGDTANISVSGNATSYSWDNGLGLGTNFNVSPSTNTTYHVTGTDINNCVNTDSIIVSVNQLPTVTASNDTSICLGDTANISVSGNATSYSWDNGLGLGTNFNVNPIINTTYHVIGTDANSCSNIDSVIISINSLPNVNASNDTTICSGDTVNISATGASNYSWNNGLGLGQNHNVTPGSTLTYVVTGTDGNGCVDTSAITITVNPCGNPPTSIFGASDSSICIGDCIDFNDLSTGAPTSWTWYFFGSSTPNSSVQNPTNICYNTIGSFDVAIVTQNAFGMDSLFIANFVTVNPLPIVTASNDTTICSGDNANISVSGTAANYSWDNGLGIGTNFNVSPVLTTTYHVTGTDVNGCVQTDSVIVTVTACNIPPVAALTSSGTILCIDDCVDFTDISTGGIPTSWRWYFEGGSPDTSTQTNPSNICYNTTGNFDVYLVVTNAFGQDSIFINNYVSVDSCITIEEDLVIPNVFSPNGDGENDLFKPYGNNITNLYMEVYNRWGELLFKTDLVNSGWNGRTTAGAICPDGTYFYLIEVNGELYKGTLTLIR